MPFSFRIPEWNRFSKREKEKLRYTTHSVYVSALNALESSSRCASSKVHIYTYTHLFVYTLALVLSPFAHSRIYNCRCVRDKCVLRECLVLYFLIHNIYVHVHNVCTLVSQSCTCLLNGRLLLFFWNSKYIYSFFSYDLSRCSIEV